MACIFLASKAEEEHRRAREVVLVFHRMQRRKLGLSLEPLIVGTRLYDELKASMTAYERQVLIQLGFDLHVDLPHKYAINFMQVLQLSNVRHLLILRVFTLLMHFGMMLIHLHDIFFRYSNYQEQLLQHVWNLINASLRTTLPIRFEADEIACGLIYLGARQCGIALPEEDPPWWRLFHMNEETLREVASVVLAALHVYEEAPPSMEMLDTKVE